MDKYKLEGGIDFFAELYKSLDIEESDENNICLITNQPLTDKFVSLNCGHKFNYIPLYNDLVNHRRKFNIMEASNERLSLTEIRCPYCRSKQDGLLPYYEDLGLSKVTGVNHYNSQTMKDPTNRMKYKCEYQIKNNNFNSLEPESDINKPFVICGALSSTKIFIHNKLNPLQPINYNDNKCYCSLHKAEIIKHYKAVEKEQKQKILLENKMKLHAEKQKAKEEKQLAKNMKLQLSSIYSENIVLGQSTVEIEGCIQILKTGPNKGKKCGCKIVSENLCKRHSLKNQGITINNL